MHVYMCYVRMHGCMYVCIDVCMYAYQYVCMYVCMYVCICVLVYVCMILYVYGCIYVCMAVGDWYPPSPVLHEPVAAMCRKLMLLPGARTRERQNVRLEPRLLTLSFTDAALRSSIHLFSKNKIMRWEEGEGRKKVGIHGGCWSGKVTNRQSNIIAASSWVPPIHPIPSHPSPSPYLDDRFQSLQTCQGDRLQASYWLTFTLLPL